MTKSIKHLIDEKTANELRNLIGVIMSWTDISINGRIELMDYATNRLNGVLVK